MAKKMTVQEILAAARAEKQAGAGGGTAGKSSAEAAAEAAPESAAPAAEPPKATPKPAGKPGSMSVAEIMAAARAQKAGGAAAPAAKPAAPAAEKPAPKPVAEKPAPAKVAAAAAAPAGPVVKDTASVLAAARKTAKPGPVSKAEVAEKPEKPAGKVKLAVPPMPPRPQFPVARPAAALAEDTTRRGFMAGVTAVCGVVFGSSLAVGFTSLVVTHLMWVLGLARFMFPNILIEPPTRFKVGPPSLYAGGQVETKYIPQFGVWIVRWEYEGQPIIYALKSVCTHLGCTPNWLEAEQKFKCPCHGSGFYKDGVNFEGPAPRPLERYAIALADDGQLEVDKSRVFFQEQGQWKDPNSFVPV